MEFILTPDEMRKADSVAINDYGIPGSILMENAASSAAEFIDDLFLELGDDFETILILCGSGNNGGDGFALARHFCGMYDITVAWLGSEEKMSPETLTNFNILKKMDIELIHLESVDDIEALNLDFDCIVDSMIGVGGSENLRGLAIPLLQKINAEECLKIAVDAPTGLNTENGKIHQDCFLADMTVTMFAIKTGMLLGSGPEVCGIIEVACLGAPDDIIDSISKITVLEDIDWYEEKPLRERRSSKFDYGRVMIIAGSEKMPGAASLCANSAIVSGSGLVYLYSPSVHSSVLPEVIIQKLPVTDTGTISSGAIHLLKKDSEKMDVIVIGPGMGNNEETLKMLNEFIYQLPENKKVIIDADAVKALDIKKKLNKNVLITPHTGEFSGLTGVERNEVEERHHDLAMKWADKLNCNILLKYFPTVITDGVRAFWNDYGNPGMATAGSGDVLTGIIAGLAAQGMDILEGGAYGAFLHSQAGDDYAEDIGETSLTATEIINSLKIIIDE